MRQSYPLKPEVVLYAVGYFQTCYQQLTPLSKEKRYINHVVSKSIAEEAAKQKMNGPEDECL